MLRNLSFVVLLLALPNPASSQEAATPGEARRLADQATEIARGGKLEEALRLYSSALVLAPDDATILRDYAVVLGWAEKYSQAIPIIEKILSIDSDQPDWALREFARTLLFGDRTEDALRRLNQLVDRGDITEETLARRAMALRWLGRHDEAEAAYKDLRGRYPQSAIAYTGLAYTASDRGQLSDALRILESAPDGLKAKSEIVVARIQILNWMGRHYEAQRLLADVPAELSDNRDVLKERVYAERWGGSPSDAMRDIRQLVSRYPDDSSRGLFDELKTEYGHAVTSGFRYSKDNDGLVDRVLSLGSAFHINPDHVLHAGYEYRWLQQGFQGEKTLVRYNLGWDGALTRHVAIYTNIASVDYRKPGLSRKLAGDASVSISANDTLRIGGGGGVIAMDAFQSIDHQVTAPFGFGELGLTLGTNRVQGRYSFYTFSDDVNRSRVDGQFMHSFLVEPAIRMSAGFRGSVMSHSDFTPDFYSPSRLQSYFGVGQFRGRLTPWFDYNAEVAAGWQSEAGSPLMHPFQISGGMGWNPSRHLRLAADGGKSTASMDRIGSGLRTYSRWSASGSIEIRIP